MLRRLFAGIPWIGLSELARPFGSFGLREVCHLERMGNRREQERAEGMLRASDLLARRVFRQRAGQREIRAFLMRRHLQHLLFILSGQVQN